MKKFELQSISRTGDTHLRPVSSHSYWKWAAILAVLIATLAFSYDIKNIFAATDPAPAPTSLVSITDVNSFTYPLSLPSGGGPVSFTYKVTNLSTVPLSDVTVADDNCSAMSGHLGDTNGNGLLDTDEVWIYSCTTIVRQTTTNIATVTAYASGTKAAANNTITVSVAASAANENVTSSPILPNTGSSPLVPGLPANGTNPNTLDITAIIWEVLGGILVVLIIFYLIIRNKK
jgi:hypothetical protein